MTTRTDGRLTPQQAKRADRIRRWNGSGWFWGSGQYAEAYDLVPPYPEWRHERIRLVGAALDAGERDHAKAIRLAEELLPQSPRPADRRETGRGPGKLAMVRLGLGFLFRREETMLNLLEMLNRPQVIKPLKKALKGVIAGILTVVGAWFLSADFQALFAEVPTSAMWVSGLGLVLSHIVVSIAGHFREYTPAKLSKKPQQ